jgi:hypothetical protein
MGLMPGKASAGSITLSVDLGGLVIFTATSIAPDQSVSANLIALNAALTAHGSAYQFQSLSANSNYTGAGTGFLQTNAQLNTSGPGTTADTLSIDTEQSGFLSPVGPNGNLTSSLAANSSSTTTGTTTFTSNYENPATILSPPLVFAAPGVFSGSTVPMAVGAVPSGYGLSNHFLINLAVTPGASLGITGTATLGATTVPEPTSVVIFMTSLPLAFIGMVHYRRRALSKG